MFNVSDLLVVQFPRRAAFLRTATLDRVGNGRQTPRREAQFAAIGVANAECAESRRRCLPRDGPVMTLGDNTTGPPADWPRDVATVLSLPARALACPRDRDARRSCAGWRLR